MVKRAIFGRDHLAVWRIEPDADRLIGGEPIGEEQEARSGRAGLGLNRAGSGAGARGDQQRAQ
jgi:hypothetical protein